MLVRLYALPALEPSLAHARSLGVLVRRSLVVEKPRLLAWVDLHFPAWHAEVEVTYARVPVTAFIAIRAQAVVGFACYDALCPNFFGPSAVDASERRHGIGRALLLSALHAQHAQGYAYAIVGGVGPAEFYARSAGATLIEGSSEGIYAGLLRPAPPDVKAP